MPALPVTRLRNRLSREERRRMLLMFGVIALLHAVGFFVLLALVAPAHHAVGEGGITAGVGSAAYTLGIRHAFERTTSRPSTTRRAS